MRVSQTLLIVILNAESVTHYIYIFFIHQDPTCDNKNINILISTSPHTKVKTLTRLTTKITVKGMKGDSELTVKPDYLSKELCNSLSDKIRQSMHLRQYYHKRQKNDEMRPG